MSKLKRGFIKWFSLMTLFLYIFVQCSTISANAFAFTPPFTINSESGIILNLDTNTVIYEKNADKQQMPAHLAQIMTAIIVLEHCEDIDGTKITMNQNPASYFYDYEELEDIRYANILMGDTFTVREYLYAMMLTSSCESAMVLANYFGNDNENTFVAMMNAKAAEIGCTGTNFTNPTGLYNAYQITTARDMMKITQYALKNDTFREISTTTAFVPTSMNQDNHPASSTLRWTHTNIMADETNRYYYEGATGIKTGNLDFYGRNIITMATRNDTTYLIILLKAPFNDENEKLQYYHLDDAIALLDWAFSDFTRVTLIEDDEELAEVKVESADDSGYVLVRPEKDCITLWCTDVDITAIQKTITLHENVHAPVKKGDVLGVLELKFSGEVIDTIQLVAVSDVKRSFIKHNLHALKSFPTSVVFQGSLIVACVITLIYIICCLYSLYLCHKKAREEGTVHLIPKAIRVENHAQKNWKRSSEPVFYHRPDEQETSGANRKPSAPSQRTIPKRTDPHYTKKN